MKEKKKKSGYLIWVVIISILIIGLIFVFSGNGAKYELGEIEKFAKCLTEKGTVMYGAFWCPHCAKTKKKFGNSFQYINYVECDPRGENEQSELCIEKNIERYDTWEFSDGSRDDNGEPSFEFLSSKTGCTLPLEKS